MIKQRTNKQPTFEPGVHAQLNLTCLICVVADLCIFQFIVITVYKYQSFFFSYPLITVTLYCALAGCNFEVQ